MADTGEKQSLWRSFGHLLGIVLGLAIVLGALVGLPALLIVWFRMS